MMETSTEFKVLNTLADPVIVVEPSGTIRLSNRAADRLFGPAAQCALSDLVANSPDEVELLLRRSARSGSPIVGSLAPARQGSCAVKVWACRLASDDPAVVLRFEPAKLSEFSVLSDKIQQLNAEMTRRRRAQAVLEEALRHNQLLLRELNHRVKNNIQMLAGLFSARLREPGPPELRAFLQTAIQRLMAIGSVQRLMYEGSRAAAVPLDKLLDGIVESLQATVPEGVVLEIDTPNVTLSNDQAHPVALIVNELVTNALKHGAHDGGRVRAGAFRRDGELVLFVEDDGPGLQDGQSSSHSGLGLVRGLARQLGGKINFVNRQGLRCEVSFAPHPVEATQ